MTDRTDAVDLDALTEFAWGTEPCVACAQDTDRCDQWGNAWCEPCWERKLAGDDPRTYGDIGAAPQTGASG